MGAGDTEESCLLMMLIILFLISCKNPKAWVLGFQRIKMEKCSKKSEGLRGVCALSVHTQECVHRKSVPVLPGTGDAPKFRSQQGSNSSFAPSRESREAEGTGTGLWPPGPGSCEWELRQWWWERQGRLAAACALLRQDVSSHFTSALPLHLSESSVCHTNN